MSFSNFSTSRNISVGPKKWGLETMSWFQFQKLKISKPRKISKFFWIVSCISSNPSHHSTLNKHNINKMLIQVGPSITNIDVTPHMVFYGGGVYYNSTQCSNYASEPVPNECLGDGGEGFSCLTRGEIKCSELLPDHCDRWGAVSLFLQVTEWVSLSGFLCHLTRVSPIL